MIVTTCSLICGLALSLHQFLSPRDQGPLHDRDETPSAWPRIWPFWVNAGMNSPPSPMPAPMPLNTAGDKHTTPLLGSPFRFITVNFRWALHATPSYTPLPESSPSPTSRELFHTCYSPDRLLPHPPSQTMTLLPTSERKLKHSEENFTSQHLYPHTPTSCLIDDLHAPLSQPLCVGADPAEPKPPPPKFSPWLQRQLCSLCWMVSHRYPNVLTSLQSQKTTQNKMPCSHVS